MRRVQVDRDLALIKELDLNLKYGVNTHCHAGNNNLET